MKKSLLSVLMLTMYFIGGDVVAKTKPAAAQAPMTAAKNLMSGDFEIDSAHTRISFIIPHFVISEVEGRFDEVTGLITIGKSFLDAKFEAVVPAKSIDTGIKQRDDHLRSSDFFDVEKYPDIKFVSKTITGTKDNFKMVASVTIKGVTKDVLFSGAYTGGIKDTFGKERIALKATGKVNRKDFNINYNDKFDLGPVVGDMVEIRIWTEATKKQ